MKLAVTKNTTSLTTFIKIVNSASTVGAGLTGITAGSAGLSAAYVRSGDVSSGGANNPSASTAISLALVTPTAAYSSGGFCAVNDTTMPGIYRFDVPNAVIASGSDSAVVTLFGATNMLPTDMEFQLKEIPSNSTQFLGTGLSAFSGILNTNTIQILGTGISSVSGIQNVNAVQFGGSGASSNNGILNVNTVQLLGTSISASSGIVNSNQVRVLGTGTSASAGVLNVNATQWKGTAIATPDTAGYPVTTVKNGSGSGELLTSAGIVQGNVIQFAGSATIDGIGITNIYRALVAAMVGKVVISAGPTAGTNTLTVYAQNGTSVAFSITPSSTDGSRTGSSPIL